MRTGDCMPSDCSSVVEQNAEILGLISANASFSYFNEQSNRTPREVSAAGLPWLGTLLSSVPLVGKISVSRL